MIVLGLTGSIGMGKSTVGAMFESLGVPVFDADAEVHKLQAPGGKALAAIEKRFPGTTGKNGLDRAKLGQMVFEDVGARHDLEAIIHPLVRDAQTKFMKDNAGARIVVLDIPLLFEGDGWKFCDATLVVSAPAWLQRKRVLRRPGMRAEKFAAILKTQMPDREKRRRADFVIHTNRPKSRTRHAVRKLVSCLKTRGVRYCKSCARLSSTPRRQGSTRRAATGFVK